MITFVLASTLIGLTGCAGNNQNAGGDNNDANLRVNNVRNNIRNNDNNGITGRNVSNQNLRVSTRASNNVERLREVDQAHVIIRNNDAYVAVRLNNQGTTGDRAGNGTTINRDVNSNARNTQNTANTGNTGITGNYTNSGVTGTTNDNLNTGAGAISGNNTGAGTDRITGTNTNTGNNGINGTGNNMGNTGNNGTGMNGNNGTGGTNFKEVSTQLEQRIADQVRASDKKIHKVYVSYDNDFYTQMNTYSNDLQNGRNRDGIWDDFTGTVRRFFD